MPGQAHRQDPVQNARNLVETAADTEEEVNRPAWTISEAVERTGASRSTIRRYRDAAKFPHAYKDTAGIWRVPIEDLLAAGLKVSDPAQAEQVNQPSDQAHPEPDQAAQSLREQVAELERALAVEQARNEGLERLAQAAQDNARDLRQALRMLEVSRPEQPTSEHLSTVTKQAMSSPADHPLTYEEPTPEQPTGPMPRAGWLSRFKRLKTLP